LYQSEPGFVKGIYLSQWRLLRVCSGRTLVTLYEQLLPTCLCWLRERLGSHLITIPRGKTGARRPPTTHHVPRAFYASRDWVPGLSSSLATSICLRWYNKKKPTIAHRSRKPSDAPRGTDDGTSI